MLFVCHPKFCISIVFSFSWGHFNSQEKLKTISGWPTKSIMVCYGISGVVNLQAWPRIWIWDYRDQIQLSVRAGPPNNKSKLFLCTQQLLSYHFKRKRQDLNPGSAGGRQRDITTLVLHYLFSPNLNSGKIILWLLISFFNLDHLIRKVFTRGVLKTKTPNTPYQMTLNFID